MNCFFGCLSTSGINSSKNNILELIGLLFIFALVLVACYFVTRFVANKQMGYRNKGNFEIIDTLPVAQNKYLQIVRIGKKYIVISICKDTVSYITEIEKSDLAEVNKEGAQNIGFSDMLSKFLNKNSSFISEDTGDSPEKKSDEQ